MYFSLGAFTVFALIQWLRERPLSGTTTLAAMALAQPLSAVFAISSLPLGTYPPPSFGVSLLSLPYTLLQEVAQLDKGFVAHFLFSGLGFRYVIPNLICPVLAVPISLFLAKQVKYFLMARSSVSKLRVEK